MGEGNVYGEYGEIKRWGIYLVITLGLYIYAKLLLYALQNDLFVQNDPEDRRKKFDWSMHNI